MQERACGDAHYTHLGFSHYVTEIPPCPDTTTPSVVTGFVGGSLVGTGTIPNTLTVVPATATCSAYRVSGDAAQVSLTGLGSPRTVSVRMETIGEVEVAIFCVINRITWHNFYATFTFTAPPPPNICENTLGTLGVDTVIRQGAWSATDSCLSTQRGDDQSRYYAERYTFTLVTDSTVVVTVAPAAPTDPRPVLYVLSAAGDLKDPETGQPGEYELADGDYIIEVTTTTANAVGNFTLSVSMATTGCPSGETHMAEYGSGTDNGCRPERCQTIGDNSPGQIRNYSNGWCRAVPGGQELKRFNEAILDGVHAAARTAVANPVYVECVTRATNPVTANKLAAYMLAVAIREVGSDPSLMTLSRWDSIFTNRPNVRNLFSRGVEAGEPRAHWSPGVGPWQLDWWTPVTGLNHAERANVNIAAPKVAAHILPALCGTMTGLETLLINTWNGCKPRKKEDRAINHCIREAGVIYDETNDSLWVSRMVGADVDGGVKDRRCKWGTGGAAFACYLYDMNNAQGVANIDDVDGTLDPCSVTQDDDRMCYRITPLPSPFLSFSADGRTYAAFPRADIVGRIGTVVSGTGYDHTLIRAVPDTEANPRASTLGDGSGWFEDTVDGRTLYVQTCSSSGPLCWAPV